MCYANLPQYPRLGGKRTNVRKDTINFSLLTEVHPMIETFPLEQVSVAYEK
ncbi:zinc-binding dehydrogenase [Desulfitobacterium sp. AusDCA]